MFLSLNACSSQPVYHGGDANPHASHNEGETDRDVDGQAALDLHVDDAEITLNVCLGSDQFEGNS